MTDTNWTEKAKEIAETNMEAIRLVNGKNPEQALQQAMHLAYLAQQFDNKIVIEVQSVENFNVEMENKRLKNRIAQLERQLNEC